MIDAIGLLVGAILCLFRTRRTLLLENLALRQQLAALKRRHPRPRLAVLDKLFWVLARRFWFGWKQALIVVSPETVVRWHRSGFALYWRALSRARQVIGRKRISKEVRDLIFRIVAENPTWGAPRIHGELRMLGFDVSERTISRWMKRAPRDPEQAKRWLAFLRNHREAIATMDFFTVPTLRFSVLYGFFVISHDRRQILNFNVTKHPTSLWIVQQLREAFPFESSPRFLIFDRDGKYGAEVPAAVRPLKIRPVRTSFESPWQNGVAERWVMRRTAVVNQIRSLLLERGLTLPKGRRYVDEQLPRILEDAELRLSNSFRVLLAQLKIELEQLTSRIEQMDRVIQQTARENDACQRLTEIPGVGPVTATALIAAVGNGSTFRKGRDLAAWMGIVPRECSTGGKQKLLGISKRGNAYLRTLFVQGARSVVQQRHKQAPGLSSWLAQLLARAHQNVVIVALANKLVRMAWAVLCKNERYRAPDLAVST
jgi:putative transposase